LNDDSLKVLPLIRDMVIGGYQLKRKLGSGGMAEAWLAFRTGEGGKRPHFAVIKTPLPSVADDPRFVRMFRNEVELSSQLTNSNIVKVLTSGHEHGRAYLVMEWVDGAALQIVREAIVAEPLEVRCRFAAYIAAQILYALDYAHSLIDETGRPIELVHRDVTPHNVLISTSGEVKLIDFGVAHFVGDKSSGYHVKGKMRYMAPEHLAGHSHSQSVDLFPVGAILYELIEGVKFRADLEDDRIMSAHIVGGKLPTQRVTVDPALEKVRRGLLEPTVARRFKSAEAAIEALRQWDGFRDMKLDLARLVRRITGSPGPRTGYVDEWNRAAPPPEAKPVVPPAAGPEADDESLEDDDEDDEFARILAAPPGSLPPSRVQEEESEWFAPQYALLHNNYDDRPPPTASVAPRDPDAPLSRAARRSFARMRGAALSKTEVIPPPPPFPAAPATFPVLPVASPMPPPPPASSYAAPPIVAASPVHAQTAPHEDMLYRRASWGFTTPSPAPTHGTDTRFIVARRRGALPILTGAGAAILLGIAVAAAVVYEPASGTETAAASSSPLPSSDTPSAPPTSDTRTLAPVLRPEPKARVEIPDLPPIPPPPEPSQPASSPAIPSDPPPETASEPRTKVRKAKRDAPPPTFTQAVYFAVDGYESATVRIGSATFTAAPFYGATLHTGRFRPRYRFAGETKWRTAPTLELQEGGVYTIRIDAAGFHVKRRGEK